MTLSATLRRAGLGLPALERSVWVIAPGAAEVEAAYPALDAALERRPGYPLVLSAPAGGDLDRLTACFEREVVVPLPYSWALRQLVRMLSPRLVVVLGSDRLWRANWLRSLQVLRVTVIGFDAVIRPAAETLAASLPKLADSGKLRESWRKPRRLARFVRSSPGCRAVDLFGRRRIESWDELRRALGQPRTILCLGNGPSSEHPALAGTVPDALFRVNWRWRARGFLTSPQLVFVGDPRTPNHLSATIFGFRSAEDANYVLWRQCFGLRLPRFRFFVFDDLPSPAGERSWAARLTNGAIMVATAVALRPQRLMVAGIDLYRHPLGRYPGETEALDGYNRVHHRDVEIDFMRRALQGFPGELEILSPILSAALARDTSVSGGRRSGP
jgi:3-Deoxy-D-manno-octulosonic-acid transferase (kdotransferase)